MVYHIAQHRCQDSGAFHAAEEEEAQCCGAISGWSLVDDVCLRHDGAESHDNADDDQHGPGTESVRGHVEKVNRDAARNTHDYDYRHLAKAVR